MRTFSIITACKGRLEHLKRTLPRMLELGAEVVVVDYSCPEKTADYVERNFPAARVVRVEGEPGFSNWKARNRGAAAATGEMLVFCDADTLLSTTAIDKMAARLPAGWFGSLIPNEHAKFPKRKRGLEANQFRGFQVVPSPAFRATGGYDEVLEGYGAGGDVDLGNRLILRGLKLRNLGVDIIEDVIEHDSSARLAHHRDPVTISYAAGSLYRRAKTAVMGGSLNQNLPLAMRAKLFAAARRAAAEIAGGKDSAAITIELGEKPLGMPRQLGYDTGALSLSVTVRLSLEGKLEPGSS